MKYFLKNIYNYTDYFYQYNYNLLNSYQKRKIKKLKNIDDKKLSLLGLILVSQELNVDINNIHYKNKKPYVKNNKYFSISHKNPYVCIAISDFSIGIDIEILREIDEATLKYLGVENSIEALIDWTRKESLIKAKLQKEYDIRTFILNKELVCSICYQKNKGKH